MAEPPALLFDTTALIDIYRGRPALRQRFQAVLDRELAGYLSAISEAELWRGIRAAEVERHEAILSFFRSLPLDTGAARTAGTWMNRYESHGLGWMDALITATAQRAGLTILTRDVHLARVMASEADFELYPTT
jgi:predicted nucleic acid-binding protein